MARPAGWCYSAVLVTSLLTSVDGGRQFGKSPSFAEPIDNRTVSLHRDVTLACVVNHLGSHKVAWIHLDRQSLIAIGERLITQLPQFSVYHDRHKTWYLRIRDVRREDGGAYMCQVNTDPMLKQEGFVTVVVPPNILDAESSRSEVSVEEGSNVELTCRADGEPTPSISWRREDNAPVFTNRPDRVYNGTTLAIRGVTRRAMGAFLCIANNGVPPSPSKMITLKVRFAPTIEVKTQLHSVPLNTTVRLVCRSEAHPRAFFYWLHRGNLLLPTPTKYTIDNMVDGYRTTMQLTIHNIQPEDFGPYKCVSKNQLGEAEETIQIHARQMAPWPRTQTPLSGANSWPPQYQHNYNQHPAQDGQGGFGDEGTGSSGYRSRQRSPSVEPPDGAGSGDTSGTASTQLPLLVYCVLCHLLTSLLLYH